VKEGQGITQLLDSLGGAAGRNGTAVRLWQNTVGCFDLLGRTTESHVAGGYLCALFRCALTIHE